MRLLGLLLDNLLQHLSTEWLERKIGIEPQLQKIRLDQIAVKTATATTQVQNSTLQGIPAWVEYGHWKCIEMHLLLIQQEEIESIVGLVCLPHWKTQNITLSIHICLYFLIIYIKIKWLLNSS